jgi:hypothetical protein
MFSTFEKKESYRLITSPPLAFVIEPEGLPAIVLPSVLGATLATFYAADRRYGAKVP